jgi:DNA helicase-2/ATP-dependent DNA helicase PcrA
MTIESFTTEEFVRVVLGFPGVQDTRTEFQYGEHVVFARLDSKVKIKIRSSIGQDGKSAVVGENSIRLSLITDTDGLLAIIDQVYVTRVPGWQDRLKEKFRLLVSYRERSGDCRKCGQALRVFISHTEKNPDRAFAKCTGCGEWVNWLDQMRPYFEKPRDMSRAVSQIEQVAVVTDRSVREIMVEIESADTEKNEQRTDDLLDILDDVGTMAIVPVSIPTRPPNAEQLRMIKAPILGAYRVLAGPGSGKTFAMVRRWVHLVENGGVNPEKIVMVTFGNRAAGELLKRLTEIYPAVQGSGAEWLVTTIHAFSFRVLKLYGILSGVTVVDEKNMWKIRRMVEEGLIEIFPNSEDRPQWRESYEWLETCKHHGQLPGEETKRFLKGVMSEEYAAGLTQLRDYVDSRMKAENLITFTDMPYLMDVNIRINPTFYSWLKAKFSHTLLDEGQDTSHQAMRILSAISDNFMVVGDTDQLLYRFAGATPEANMLDGFEAKFPDGTLFKLSRNYRSARQVVLASHMIVQNYAPAGPYEMRYFKVPEIVSSSIGNVSFVETTDPFEDAQVALSAIIGWVNEKQVSGQPDVLPQVSGTVFVAMRTRAYSVYFEDAFARAGIPYVNTTGMTFWNLPHVQKLISYLRIALNFHDTDAFEKIYNVPSNLWTHPWRNHPAYGTYINTHLLARTFLTEYPSYGKVLNHAGYGKMNFKYRDASDDLVYIFDGFGRELQKSLVDGLRWIVQNVLTAYYTYEDGQAMVTDGEGGKFDDFGGVLEMAGLFDNPEKFLTYVDDLVEAAEAARNADWNNRVVISTIHKLKGLEREHVILAGASEYDKVSAKGVVSLLPHTFTFVDPPQTGKLPGSHGGRMEDERCLFFVAITRAKEDVLVLSPQNYRGNPMETSRFAAECQQALLEEVEESYDQET